LDGKIALGQFADQIGSLVGSDASADPQQNLLTNKEITL